MVKVPLSCDGHHAGNFVWDFRGGPVVKDLVGQVVSAQAVPRQAFSEDSVGITLLNPRLDTLGGMMNLTGIFTWRLMPGDTISAGDSVHVSRWDPSLGWITKGAGVLDAKGTFSIPLVSDFSGDTLEVAVVKPGFGAGVKLSMSALKIAPAVAGRIALPR